VAEALAQARHLMLTCPKPVWVLGRASQPPTQAT
jgi:hypothetical protein